jgi:hypothetical protein
MNLAGGPYDVFFSYQWRDHAEVEAVARALIQKGLNVFLVRWYLVPGRSWPKALEEILATCRAVAIFVGPQGLGTWQHREKDLALSRQARQPEFPVIPVLLPRADPALGFLSQNTWVDLRQKLDDPVSLAILQAAVRGKPPGSTSLSGSRPPWPPFVHIGVCGLSGRKTPPASSAGSFLSTG